MAVMVAKKTIELIEGLWQGRRRPMRIAYPSTTTKTHPSFLWNYQAGVNTFKMATVINKVQPRLPDLWFHIFLKSTETFGACLSHNEGMTGKNVKKILYVRRWRGEKGSRNADGRKDVVRKILELSMWEDDHLIDF